MRADELPSLQQAEARRLLYRRVVLVPMSRAIKFYATLKANLTLGALVRNVYHHNHQSCQLFAQNVHLLPSLRELEGPWFFRDLPSLSSSPGTEIRPKLQNLIIENSTSTYLSRDPHTLAPWVDLGSLRRLEVLWPFQNLYSADGHHLKTLLQSPLIEELAFKRFATLTSTFKRLLTQKLVRLRALSITTESFSTSWPTIGWPTEYPVLQSLTLSGNLVHPVFSQAIFRSLETLRLIGWKRIPGVTPQPPTVSYYVNILCDAVAERPERYPVLREVSFPHHPSGSDAAANLKLIADELATVGLSLVDDDGNPITFS